MFSWFRPRCPIDLRNKVWVEYRLQQLIDRIGETELRRYPVLIPTANDLPEIAPAQKGHLEDLLCRLCEHLRITRQGIDLQIVDPSSVPDTAENAPGTDTRETRTIRLYRDLLDKPALLVSTLIHELLRDRLLREGILRGDESDLEHLTDLSACLFGCGIPLANSTLAFESETTGTYSKWQMWRTGYLNALDLGYALAVLQWRNWETEIPEWTRLLRLDARETFVRGLKYLRRTGDCWLSPWGESRSLQASRRNRLQRSQTDTERLASLWDIVASGVRVNPEDLLPLLRHREASIRLAACEALYRTPARPEFRDDLYSTTSDEHGAVRGAAIATFLKCYPADGNVTRIVVQGLSDSNIEAVRSTLFALWESHAWNPEIQDAVLRAFTRSVGCVSGEGVVDYLYVLSLHIPSLETFLRRQFSGPENRSELSTIISCLRMMQEAESHEDSGAGSDFSPH